jgi:AcrR family transcriptional regulator
MTKKTKEEVLEEFRCGSIQDAAIAVIARKGLAGATMQDIADEAGVAKGTVYVYFQDRNELLTKTANRAVERLLTEIDSVFDNSGSLDQRLCRIVSRQLQFFDENRELFHAYNALMRGRKTQSSARYVERIERLLAEAKERGELRDIDPSYAAPIVADCIRGVIVRRIEDNTPTPREEVTRLVVSFVLRGIQA